jgi:hypothetical protein
MTVGTAFPKNAYSAGGSWSAYNNGTAVAFASAVAYLGDSNDTTYVQPTALPSGGGRAILYAGFETLSTAIPATSQVVRTRIVGRFGGSTNKMNLRALQADYIESEAVGPVSGASVTGYQGYWGFSQTAGTVYTTSELDAITGAIYLGDTTAKCAQIRYEFDYYATPVGTPTSATPNTDKPAITWNFTQADSLTQSSAYVKVFSSAVYGAGGFDANYSSALFSTVVAGTALTVTAADGFLTTALVFKPYVQVIADSYGIPVKGTFTPSTTAYTASFTAPTKPTVTATYSAATTGTAQRAVSVTIAGSASPFRYDLLCNGTSLVTAGTMATNGTTVYIDRLMPRGTAVTYTARVTTAATASPQLSSVYGTGTVTPTAAIGWEFTSLDTAVSVSDYASPVSGITFNRAEANAVFRPLGSKKSVVISGDMTGDDGTITWTTSSRTSWETVKALLTYQGPMRVTSPFTYAAGGNESWVVRLTSRDWNPAGSTAIPVNSVNAAFVEVNPVDTSVV